MTLFGCAKASASQRATAGQQRKLAIVGYLPDYRLKSVDTRLLGKHYTDIVLFSLEPAANGSLDLRRLDPAGFNMALQLKRAGVQRVLICVGGSQRSSHFAAAAASPESRSTLIAALADLCTAHQLDGVDFDWEHPKSTREWGDYSHLLVEAKRTFAKKKLLVSVAVAAWHELDATALAAADRVNLMAYDAPGEHATLSFAEDTVAAWEAKGARPGQICLGVPFYGRGIEHHHRTLTYATLAGTYSLDPKTDQVGDYYFNGVSTLHEKAEFAWKNGLAGMMVWEVGQDTPDGRLGSALQP